jgi:hypothetical protein
MWEVGNQDIIIPERHFNEDLVEMRGEMDDATARITLAKFLKSNIGLTTELFLGIKLEKYQEITIKAMFNRNFSMLTWGRGASKSFCAAVFCILQCIFEPGTKILIASANFRTSRRLFMEIDKMLNSKDASLAKQCFKDPVKRNDEYVYPVEQPNGGSITAIPLGGENTRGYRASVLIIDEFLLMPKDIVERVLMPFMSSPLDVAERIRVREVEDQMIKAGRMQEKDRTVFKNMNKMITLSSASYTFEYLFELYSIWSDIIRDPNILADSEKIGEDRMEAMKNSTYFVSQMSYESLPEHMIDQGVIQLAKSGGISHSAFLREYCARFVDGGDGYFSPKKMTLCTVPNGQYPTTKIVGDRDKKYVLAIDPSFSASKSSDYFAMALLELNEEDGTSVYIHGYQKAGTSIQDHIKYFYYLLTHFNISLIIIDNAGGDQFIEAANGSAIFKAKGMKVGFFEFNSDKEGDEYNEMLKEAKSQYNIDTKTICIKQYFTSSFIGRANGYLQSCIDHKRVWFASASCAHPDIVNQMFSLNIPIEYIYPKGIDDAPDDALERAKLGIRDFMEQQDFIIKDTKDQCALIQVSSTARGTQSFDLPGHLRRLTSANKPRKDNYSALMLGNWAVKVYFDLNSERAEKPKYNFTPFFL